jgi:hypothetical protein
MRGISSQETLYRNFWTNNFYGITVVCVTYTEKFDQNNAFDVLERFQFDTLPEHLLF